MFHTNNLKTKCKLAILRLELCYNVHQYLNLILPEDDFFPTLAALKFETPFILHWICTALPQINSFIELWCVCFYTFVCKFVVWV